MPMPEGHQLSTERQPSADLIWHLFAGGHCHRLAVLASRHSALSDSCVARTAGGSGYLVEEDLGRCNERLASPMTYPILRLELYQ